MRFKDKKVHIKKDDLHRRVILVKNYESEDELMSVQAGVLDANPEVLVFGHKSFKKYNDFRVKNGGKAKTIEEVTVYDVAKMKEEHKAKIEAQQKELADASK